MTKPQTVFEEPDAYAEGREAHDAGKSEDANPYEIDTDDFMSWNDGWSAAAEDAEGADE